MPETITIETTVNAPVEKVWEYYTQPEHVTQWNHASDDWHSPSAENDLRVGGKFTYRMESKDRTEGFDFSGRYTKVESYLVIQYVMDDERKVTVTFTKEGDKTHVRVDFEAEETNSLEMQRDGWQSILNNFKKYVENN